MKNKRGDLYRERLPQQINKKHPIWTVKAEIRYQVVKELSEIDLKEV